jgi:hypothetical protein
MIPPTLAQLRAALHPLDAEPPGEGWNREELTDLLRAEAAPIAAAVLVGLVPRAQGFQVLLTRRNDDMRHHPGQVSFPAAVSIAAISTPRLRRSANRARKSA